MAKREEFSGYVKCEKCGTDGHAHFEENVNPVTAGGLETELVGVDEPFRMVAGSVYCQCGHKVR